MRARIRYATTSPKLYEELRTRYEDSDFPVWWFSPARARAQGEEAAINLYKGKRILSVYTPIDWPEMLTYQTPEGGLKEKWFS